MQQHLKPALHIDHLVLSWPQTSIQAPYENDASARTCHALLLGRSLASPLDLILVAVHVVIVLGVIFVPPVVVVIFLVARTPLVSTALARVPPRLPAPLPLGWFASTAVLPSRQESGERVGSAGQVRFPAQQVCVKPGGAILSRFNLGALNPACTCMIHMRVTTSVSAMSSCHSELAKQASLVKENVVFRPVLMQLLAFAHLRHTHRQISNLPRTIPISHAFEALL